MASGISASLMAPKAKYELKKNMNTTRLHVIPVGDEQHGKLKLHVAAQDCWCHPTEKDDVVTHNAFDCREKLERQEVETGKIWTHVLENKRSEEIPSADTPEFAAALVLGLLARNMEDALRSHMTNYGGAPYAESAIARIKEDTMKSLPNDQANDQADTRHE